MKLAVLFVVLVALGACSAPAYQPAGVRDLVPDGEDLAALGMTGEVGAQDRELLGLDEGTNCRFEDRTNIADAAGGYAVCVYRAPGLNDTQVILELERFADEESLVGSYQYDSSHYFSAEGLISEDALGDRSRFRVSNEHDYGGALNDPNITYYHLWITKELFLIHLTSKGSDAAGDILVEAGERILGKFG